MPKKKRNETAEEQSERFKKEAQKLIDAGELNPTEGDQALNRVIKTGTRKPPESPDSGT